LTKTVSKFAHFGLISKYAHSTLTAFTLLPQFEELASFFSRKITPVKIGY
jgi:hypothetical protein